MRWIIAVVVSSLFWTALYFENMGWEWDTSMFINLFLFAHVYGYSLKKYGFESCVMIHFLANVMIVSTIMLLS